MSAMGALLWKEGRENVPKVLIGFGACLVILVLRQHPGFEQSFCRTVGPWATGFALVSAVVLGIDTVARERGRTTLGFLLGQPISATRVLLAKFAAGGIALGLVLAAFWLVVYAAPLEPPDHFDSYHKLRVLLTERLLADVGYATMVYQWLTVWAMVYAAAFLGSALTDNPAKAVVSGALAAGVLFLVMVLLAGRSPLVEFHGDHIFHDLSPGGAIARVAGDRGLLLVRGAVAACACGAALGLGAWAARRLPGGSVQWRTLLIGWAVLLGAWFLAVGSVRPRLEPVAPLGSLRYDAGPRPRDFVLGDRVAYVAIHTGLSIVDLSDPRTLREIGRIEVPLWSMTHVAIAGSSVYLAGTMKSVPTDSTGIAVLDVSDPSQPRLRGRRLTGPVRATQTYAIHALADTGLCVVGASALLAEVATFGLGKQGMPGPPSVLQMEISTEDTALPDFFKRRQFRPSTHLAGQHLLLSLPGGVTIADVSRIGTPREVGLFELEEVRTFVHDRPLVVDGERMYVQRYWPRELAVLDVSDPARPREVGAVYAHMSDHSTVADGIVYTPAGGGIWASRLDRTSGLMDPAGKFVPPEEKGGIHPRKMLIEGDHLYALWHKGLDVYPLLK